MRKLSKKNKKTRQTIVISTPHGKLSVVRNMDYCMKCGKLFGQNDDVLGISNEHRITRDFLEVVTYTAQMIPGFKNAEEVLQKLKGIEVSATQIELLSEEVGKEIFDIQMKKANTAFKSPEIAAPEFLEKNKKDTILYILADGSAVNTRNQDENGST